MRDRDGEWMQEKSCLHMSALGLVYICKPVTITSVSRVQGGLSPAKLEES